MLSLSSNLHHPVINLARFVSMLMVLAIGLRLQSAAAGQSVKPNTSPTPESPKVDQ